MGSFYFIKGRHHTFYFIMGSYYSFCDAKGTHHTFYFVMDSHCVMSWAASATSGAPTPPFAAPGLQELIPHLLQHQELQPRLLQHQEL